MSAFVFDTRTAITHFPGIGRYVAGLLPALSTQLAQDERLVLLCTSTAQAAQFDALRASNAAVSVHYVQADAFSPAQQWQVRRLVGSLAAPNEALVYHSPYYLMPYWLGVPKVLTVHDLIPIVLPETVSLRARLFFRLTHRLALRSADRIIAVSEATRSDLINVLGVEEARITVIPHSVESRFHPQPQTEIERVRTTHDLPAQFVLYLGINKPHKNLVGLIQAYAMLPENAPLLVIAGAWDTRYPEARELATRLALTDRVRFLGPVNDADLPGLYSAATVFVFPSRYEGFGFPVLEAMACGTPVACSNVSSLPEVGGDAVSYFDPLLPSTIAAQLIRLLESDSLRQKSATEGVARSLQFTWEQAAAATIALYRRLHM